MQILRTDTAVIHFQARDLQPRRKTLAFINSLGTDFRIWDGVVSALDDRFNIVLHDKRGHGLSDLGNAPCAIATYADDLESLLGHLDLSQAILCGLSVGGLIAQSLSLKRPGLVEGMILSNTAVKIGSPEMWNARIKAVADGGIASIADPILERWFSPAFRKTRKGEFAIYSNMLVRTPREGYVACCEAIRDADFTPHAARLAAPALCIAGEHDGATPPALVKDTAGRISTARFELIKDAAHLPCIEQPETYAMLINAFANTLP